MNRLGIFVLVFVLMMSFSAAVSADPAQIASAVVEEAMGGSLVRVTVDLSDNWSVRYYPYAFYLYDQPFDPQADGAGEFLAYGTLFSEESFNSLAEGFTAGNHEEKDGYVLYKTADGQTAYYAPVDDGLYIGLIVDPAVDTDAVWARIAYSKVPLSE